MEAENKLILKTVLVVFFKISSEYLTFMSHCIVKIFQYISNKVQRFTVYFYLEAALHVSGGTSTHHKERIQVYLQNLAYNLCTDTDEIKFFRKKIDLLNVKNKTRCRKLNVL
jgi:hypothetical protein